jgi:hypothetical protein
MLIREYPTLYWGDAYARVLASDHLLVGPWLPLLQGVVYVVGKVTSSLVPLRLVMAAMAAAALVSAPWFAARLFSHSAGTVFAVLLGTNAMFVALSIVPYQEVAFVGLVFAGLSLHDQRDRRGAGWRSAAVFNLACLTRYEGWMLVAILAVDELLRETARRGPARGARAAVALVGRYGAAAFAWILGLVLLRETGRLGYHPASIVPATLGQRARAYVLQCGWEIASCPLRHHAAAWRWSLAVLVPLAIVGLVRALRRDDARRRHRVLVTFVAADVALSLFADPFSAGNLRETFLPVVFGLLYAAYALDFFVERTLLPLPPVGHGPGLRAVGTGIAAGILATVSVLGAVRFVAASADPFDLRVPSAVVRTPHTPGPGAVDRL